MSSNSNLPNYLIDLFILVMMIFGIFEAAVYEEGFGKWWTLEGETIIGKEMFKI